MAKKFDGEAERLFTNGHSFLCRCKVGAERLQYYEWAGKSGIPFSGSNKVSDLWRYRIASEREVGFTATQIFGCNDAGSETVTPLWSRDITMLRLAGTFNDSHGFNKCTHERFSDTAACTSSNFRSRIGLNSPMYQWPKNSRGLANNCRNVRETHHAH